VPNTEIRTLHGFFNGDPYIDIFTASTLEVNQVNPVDFLYEVYTDSPPARSQNISSVVMDRAGNVITGYYGDNYAVIDKLSTPIACAVRRTSGVYGDSQPGGPFPVAEHWIVQQENGGTDFVELSSDQETIWYTSGGRTIFRYNLTTSTQLPSFVTLPAEAGPRPGLRSVRLLPPGDGTGGLLVCDGINVKRLNASGAVIKVYTPSATDRAQDLDKVELTQDATQFWVSDQFSASLFKFDLASGAQLADVSTFLPTGQLSGFVIYLGYRAGVSPNPIPPPPTPTAVCPPARRLAPVDMGCIMPLGDF
jgi:hypothetical protein